MEQEERREGEVWTQQVTAAGEAAMPAAAAALTESTGRASVAPAG